MFGKSGVCYPDAAEVLFYWVCEGAGPLAILATVANAALTATVWAPVYMAAATVQPTTVPLAASIIALHLVGLPLGMFVLVRLVAMLLDLWRLLRFGRAPAGATAGAPAAKPAPSASARPATSKARPAL